MTTRTAIAPVAVATLMTVLVCGPSAQSRQAVEPNHALVDKIVVASDRHAPVLPLQVNRFEIYLLNLDGSGQQRITNNNVADGFGSLSPDGKKIVFYSNRNLQPGEPANTSDLFLMNADGTDQTFLIRGDSATWSPDSKYIAFQASASGTGQPINTIFGAATADSEIFVANVDDLLEHGTPPRNLTNDPDHVDDDPDWSPDGKSIVYTSHDVSQRPVPPMPFDYTSAEIYVRAADGTGPVTRLTTNTVEERAPDWSHQGDRIAYMCHGPVFGICVTDLHGNQTEVTHNNLQHLTPAWSPDDQRIFFHRGTAGRGNQLWWVATDGTTEQLLVPPEAPTGSTLFANVGVLRVKTTN